MAVKPWDNLLEALPLPCRSAAGVTSRAGCLFCSTGTKSQHKSPHWGTYTWDLALGGWPKKTKTCRFILAQLKAVITNSHFTFSCLGDPRVCASSAQSCLSAHSNGSPSWWAALWRLRLCSAGTELAYGRAASSLDGACHIYARNVIKNWKNWSRPIPRGSIM